MDSKLRLYSMQDEGFKLLDRVESYMRSWSLAIRAKASSLPPGISVRFKAKSFLAPQSVRCIMLLVQGFREFARDFFERHPGRYLVPMKYSSSFLESHFGQARAGGGDAGHASAPNYGTAVQLSSASCALRSDQNVSRHLRSNIAARARK
jgi:hypothetical protein